jgi:hypothetical protein
MPKYLSTILSILIAFQIAKANRVDDLKTDKDVAVFIAQLQKKLSGKGGEYFILKSTTSLKRSLTGCNFPVNSNIRNWAKLDINKDGLTDLLVMGFVNSFRPYLIIDRGEFDFEIILIQYGFSPMECEFATAQRGKKDFILFHRYEFNWLPQARVTAVANHHIDTLTYKFDALVEKNDHTDNLKIDSIILETTPCYGTCQIYAMRINANGNLFYQAREYNKIKGNFKSKIANVRFEEIMNVLNYIKINRLENRYRVPWTDDQTSTLTIKFTNGKVKVIEDYGMIGTFGLQKLYSLISDLRESQTWEKAY